MALTAYARAEAILHVVFKAELIFPVLYSLPAHRLVASADRVEVFQEFQQTVYCWDVAIWPKVHRSFAVDMPCLEDARQVFFRDGYRRVTFAVFKQYVVARLELFYELVFQQQGFGLRFDHGVVNIPNLRDEYSRLARFVFAVEIAADAALQVLCLAYVDYRPVLVEVLIATWRFWQTL